MPFPLGILAIRHQPRGAVAWAWGMNGIFMAAGRLLAALLSPWERFSVTILVALACYAGALSVLGSMRDSTVAAESAVEPYALPASVSANAATIMVTSSEFSADPPATRHDDAP